MNPRIAPPAIKRIAIALLCLVAAGVNLHATNGTWNTTTTGLNWSDPANWIGGVASGVDAIADFTTLNITANTTVNLNQNYTLGAIRFGDTSTPAAAVWLLVSTGGILTLETSTGKPIIHSNSMYNNGYNNISAPLAGTNGFEKTGSGFVTLSGNLSRLSGDVTVTQGRLNIVGSMANSAVTLGASGSFGVGSSGGSGSVIAGLNSTGTNGLVTYVSLVRNFVVAGDGNYSYGGLILGNTARSDNNDVLIETRLQGGGVQTLTNTASQYGGGTVVSSGTLQSASASLTGTPFGVGLVTLGGGTLKIAPTATSGDVSYTGVTGTLPQSSPSPIHTVQTTFSYGAGKLILDKGAANSLTYTIGNASAAKDSVLVRTTGTGTMMIEAGGGISALGTSEKFIVNGNSGDSVTVVNGIATAAILGRVSQSDADADASFLTYDTTNGFKEATYSASTDINGGATDWTDTRVFQATGSTTNVLSGNTGVYALRVDGVTVSGSSTLFLGANNSSTTHSTGIIMNGGAITTSTISVGASPLVIYTNAEGGTISSNFMTNATTSSTAPVVSFMGPGTLVLGSATENKFAAVAINDGTVSISNDNQLGIKSLNTGTGTLTMRNGTLVITETTALSTRAIVLSGTTNGGQGTYSSSEGGTFDVAENKTVTYTASGSGNKYMTGTGSFTKKGLGTFVLAGTSNNYTGRTIIEGGTLLLNGTAANNMISSTGASGDNLAWTDVQVKSGGTLQWGQNNQIIDSAKVALAGGTMNLNGRSEGSASADGLGFLNVFANSTIDFGAGDNGNIIRFSSINLHTADTILAILNWNGSQSGGGSERLLFSGADMTAFTSLFDQDEVTFNGISGYNAVQFSGYYEIVGVPEPSTYALLLSAGGVAFVVFRRRRKVS